MTTQRRIACLILLAGLAFGLRVWVTVCSFDSQSLPSAAGNGQIAENLLAGRGFANEFLGADGPTSQHAPFYPLLLAAPYATFGVGSPSAVLTLWLLQCVAGTALVLIVVWLAWSLVPTQPVLGCIAGLGAAVYPPHVLMVRHLDAAVWAALLLTLLLAVVVSPRFHATRRGAAFAGAISGLLLLTEPILVFALPVCVLAFWHREESIWSRAALMRVGLMVGVAAVAVSPWILRGWLVHGEPVFIQSTFGYAFWQGNNPSSWGTADVPCPTRSMAPADHHGARQRVDQTSAETRRDAISIDKVALTPDDGPSLARLSELERSRDLGRRAWRFVQENPGQYTRLCLQRLRYFLLFDETDSRTDHRVYRASTIVWLVLVFIGVLVSRGHWRAFWPLYAVFLVMTLFHMLTITAVRFRAPIEPLSFLWAASAVYPLVERIVERPLRIYRPGECPRDPFDADHALQGPHFDLSKSRSGERRRAG